MLTSKDKFSRRQRRTRAKISRVSGGGLRLSVFRSNKNIYAQIIDDARHITLASASTLDKSIGGDSKNSGGIQSASAVGRLIAEKAKASGIESVVFDRGGCLYHGRVKALADAARENGLKF